MIRFYNTLGRQYSEFAPLQPPQVGIYVCGPTVQSGPHLGHGRAAVVFDTLVRFLTWRGYQVKLVRNVTDIDDKIIVAAAEVGCEVAELAERITLQFQETYTQLRCRPPYYEPRATEHIPQMLGLIGDLIEYGHAYVSDGDVYLSVQRFPQYGQLSGKKRADLIAGARVEVSEKKRDPADFALWKAAKPGEPSWESPWGPGRPGWHIECSAMAGQYLGTDFDIHGGGSDLIFPHHENELVQFLGAKRGSFAQIWMHNGMVLLNGAKLSKSEGVVIDLAQLLTQYGGRAIRLFYLRTHYRSPLDYTPKLMTEAVTALDRIDQFCRQFPAPGSEIVATVGVMAEFGQALDDDLGTPEALACLFEAIRRLNRGRAEELEIDPGQIAAVYQMLSILGLEPSDDLHTEGISDLAPELSRLVAELELTSSDQPDQDLAALLTFRERAREQGNWEVSDRIRDGLERLGLVIEDRGQATSWHRG